MKNLLMLLTLTVLVGCGQSLDTETAERCLNGDTYSCEELSLADEANTNDDQETRLSDAEKSILCLEGELQHCDVVNPFVNIAVGDIIRLNEDYGFVVTNSMSEGSVNTVLIAQAYGQTTFAGTYGVYHRFIISFDGDITRKSVEIALPHAAYPGLERANATIDWSAELTKLNGQWVFEKTNGQIISIDF